MISSPICTLHNANTRDYSIGAVESHVISDGVYHTRLSFNTLYNQVSDGSVQSVVATRNRETTVHMLYMALCGLADVE